MINRTASKLFAIAIALAMVLSFLPGNTRVVQAAGSVSLTALASPYSENFDTLASTGTSSTVPNGWAFSESGNNANTTYTAGTGSGNSGDTYSFGAASSTERAFGGLQSGSLIPTIGASFTNNTGGSITSLDIAYIGEEWRLGTAARTDRLDFQYSTDATSLTTGAWTGVTALNFVTPDTATTGAKNGNAAPDRTAISGTISGLNIANGAVFWIRFNDFNASGADDGLAVDDFSLTPQGGAPTAPTGVGAAQPNLLLAGDSTLLTVAVTPGDFPPSTGLGVTCDLTAIGGSNPVPFFDDGTNGDVTAGDNTFSYSATVANNVTSEAKSLACTITDAQGRSGTTSISLTVVSVIPIGAVNGAVSDSENAALHRSPFAPPSGNGAGSTLVAVQGVIYERTLQAISNSADFYKGFFIQNTAATADADPNTSDGLFVFMNTFTTLIGGYTPQVGDEVVIAGNVQEFFNMTEMSSASLVKVVRSGVDIDAEVAPAVANPPVSLPDAYRYWERLQAMRVQVPQNSIVLGGRNVFSPADAEVWVARPDSTIAGRPNPYERRAFRDAHPLDDNYDPNNWDGNGYRILMGSLGIKFTANDAQALIDPVRTFSTVTNAPAGGINYSFSKYRVEVSQQPTFNEGPDPSANNPPSAVDRTVGYSIADYNLENLYDYRNNPFSGCDFTGDSGCPKTGPFLAAVNPPYDYVPANDATYQARLGDIATEIINDLHSPDILMLQEIENQDTCTVTGGALTCGSTDNADGKPDVLQELALKIAAQGGPAYDAAFDRNSSDLRGIAPSFLYRTDRVTLLPPAGDPVLGTDPAIAYAGATVPSNSDISNPKTFNAMLPAGFTGACETSWVFPRAPDVGLFRIYKTAVGVGAYQDVYVVNNHFKSGPDTCVAHRTEQAKYNAALAAFIQAANPEARVVVGGDLNVYPRPDDIALGATDQLGSLYDPGIGLKNLWEVLLGQAPESAYSYVFVGQAQTLDQMFVNSPLLTNLQEFRIAHINSDFPADYPGDVARGTSDHDPNVANFLFNTFDFSGFFQPVDNLPELNVAKAGSGIPVKFSLGGDKGLNIFGQGFPKSTKIVCDSSEPQDDIEQTVTTGNSGLQYDPLTDQYTYVWKTEKAWAGTCRQLVIKLTDGNYYTANFKFNK